MKLKHQHWSWGGQQVFSQWSYQNCTDTEFPRTSPHLRFLSICNAQEQLPSVQSYHAFSTTISSGVNYYYIIHFLTPAFLAFSSQFLVTPCWNSMLCSALKVTTASEHLTEWISGWLGGSSALHPPCQKAWDSESQAFQPWPTNG